MFMTPYELSDLLRLEEKHMESLKERWVGLTLDSDSEHAIRMGKRTELLADLEYKKSKQEKNTQTT